MCGSLHSCAPALPRFTHCARTMGDELSPLESPVSKEALRCAFPDLFDAMVVDMFLNPEGYTGHVDNGYEPSSGCFYGLNYGAIHRDTVPVWRGYARAIRGIFWKGCWTKLMSLGRVRWFDTDSQRTIALAFFEPLPIRLFDRALVRLVRAGMLRKTIESIPDVSDEETMYYPTAALVSQLRDAERQIPMI